MRILMIPPHPILIEWRNTLLAEGNRAKAVRVQRVIEKRQYINTEDDKYVYRNGTYVYTPHKNIQ